MGCQISTAIPLDPDQEGIARNAGGPSWLKRASIDSLGVPIDNPGAAANGILYFHIFERHAIGCPLSTQIEARGHEALNIECCNPGCVHAVSGGIIQHHLRDPTRGKEISRQVDFPGHESPQRTIDGDIVERGLVIPTPCVDLEAGSQVGVFEPEIKSLFRKLHLPGTRSPQREGNLSSIIVIEHHRIERVEVIHRIVSVFHISSDICAKSISTEKNPGLESLERVRFARHSEIL